MCCLLTCGVYQLPTKLQEKRFPFIGLVAFVTAKSLHSFPLSGWFSSASLKAWCPFLWLASPWAQRKAGKHLGVECISLILFLFFLFLTICHHSGSFKTTRTSYFTVLEVESPKWVSQGLKSSCQQDCISPQAGENSVCLPFPASKASMFLGSGAHSITPPPHSPPLRSTKVSFWFSVYLTHV